MNKTKKAIFQSAIEIFSDSGYEGATMDYIASRAGVAKGTLYYHFKSKEEIFKYIINEGMNLIEEEIHQTIQKENNPLEKLKTLCKAQLKVVYNNKNFFKVIMSELWGKELRQLQIRNIIDKYIKRLQSYIEDGMKQGVIKEGESGCLAYIFFGTLCSAAVYEMLNKEVNDIEELIENISYYVIKVIQI